LLSQRIQIKEPIHDYFLEVKQQLIAILCKRFSQDESAGQTTRPSLSFISTVQEKAYQEC